LDLITFRAEDDPAATFDNLFTLLNYELLWHAFHKLKRDKAPGIDGMTVDQYEVDLQANLQDLETRLHRQSYRPQPSLRREIPKGNGKTRPLGIASVEDKIVQRAVVMILERIYEVDFCDTSYGFRPGRSCHQALSALGQTIATRKVNWISDADIKGFFDNVSHEKLVELLRTRIKDPRMLWLIQRFLKAGVLIEGRRLDTTEGVPQGSVLSPLLANVYLHYVLDQWFERDVKPRLRGEAHLIRYADDFICAFEWEDDARRFQDVLRKRLARFSLELAEDKTKLLRFGRFAARESTRCGMGAPGTFDFLGFTHYCGTSRAGKFKLKRKTAAKKLRAKFQALKDWFRENLTKPTAEVWQTLCAKLHGHFHYYNVNDNWRWVVKYREAARRMGLRWLRRRSQASRVSWAAYHTYLQQHPLPNPGRITDLIAMARRASDNATANGKPRLLFP
jgi:group II intron reverse transcriptase/maturase